MLAALGLPALVALTSCADVLQKNRDGWVSFSEAYPINFADSETPVRFERQNGCIVMELPSGERFLPILPQGQQFRVEPERDLYRGRWKILGLDRDGDRVIALRSDPIAKACDAPPAFILDVLSAEPSPPVPEAIN